ncbi:MAG: chemotaxis protein CheA [Gammaproteobacteria bacterium]|nr:chemotaxis protein CheA [Gammaproteobacteria bacterium]
MSFDADEEILQDFLVEAGEILEQLNEQLVELEQSPNDKDLLNAVFRGFHTIKGGASFLGLTPLVEVCHRAEDVFNMLRNGEIEVTSQIMDVILPVLDTLNAMFDSIRAGQMPESAEPQLLRDLEAIINGDPIAATAEPSPAAADTSAPAPSSEAQAEPEKVPEPPAPVATPPATGESSGEGDITDDEFEALLNALDSNANEAAPAQASASDSQAESAKKESASTPDEISEDEFEALLDELHGKGQAPVGPSDDAGTEAKPAEAEAASQPAGANTDEISEDEFEALLDQLHGKGQAPGDVEPTSQPAAASKPAETAKPEPETRKEEPTPAKPEAAKPAPAAAAKPKPEATVQAETTVRVDTKRLDDIMNMVGELVLVRNRLVNLEGAVENDELTTAVSNLDVVTADLQTSVMKTRMQPIKKVFGRFPRVVRDLARSLQKEVALEMVGEDTDLDKNLVEALADPLVHLVRNAVDHGVEMPDVREAAGKPRKGTVILSAEQEGDHILLSIEDDGGGMDPDILRRKAVEKGIMDSEVAARLDDKEAFSLIFAPGFSTKSEISDISGRGVGMDVVKTRITQLNGSIEIDSVKGEGTRLSIKVPLTLAIIPTLMVMLGQQTFALPLVNVNEIFNLDLNHTNIIDGQLVVMVREAPLPLFYLNKWLVSEDPILTEMPDVEGDTKTRGKKMESESHVVVVHIGTQKVGFVVDQLIGQEEVVIKPLGALLHDVQGLAGATITGDGKIALILDVPSLLKRYARKLR